MSSLKPASDPSVPLAPSSSDLRNAVRATMLLAYEDVELTRLQIEYKGRQDALAKGLAQMWLDMVHRYERMEGVTPEEVIASYSRAHPSVDATSWERLDGGTRAILEEVYVNAEIARGILQSALEGSASGYSSLVELSELNQRSVITCLCAWIIDLVGPIARRHGLTERGYLANMYSNMA